MPRLKQVTGEGWGALDGQVATVANSGIMSPVRAILPGPSWQQQGVGLAAITAGAWTYRAATASELPRGSAASGYIETAWRNNGTDPVTIQLDDTGVGLAGGTGDNTDYWIDLHIQGVWDGVTPLANDTGDYFLLAITSDYLYTRLVNHSQPGFNAPGFAVYTGNSLGATPTELILPAVQSGGVHQVWGEWLRVTMHIQYGASGFIETYLNGRKVSKVATDTTGFNWSAQSLALRFPAWQGVKWRVAGGMQSWNGTDLPLRPDHELDNTPDNLVTRIFMPIHAVATGGATQGVDFVTSGTGTITPTSYTTVGNTPFRNRFVFSGNGSTSVATTIDEIGDLPYDSNGWASIVLSDVSAPSGTILQFHVNRAGSASEVLRFMVTASSLYAVYPVGAQLRIGPWQQDKRYSIVLHLNQNGRASVTWIDVSTGPMLGAIKTIWSHPLADWTPQPLGSLKLTANTTASNIEVGYIAVCRRPSFTTLDSLSSTNFTGVSPQIRTSNCIPRAMLYGQEAGCIPGGYWPQKEFGLARRIIVAPIGAAGLTRADWSQMAGSGLRHTHGVEFIAIDGGSINDIAQIATTDGVNLVTQISRDLRQFVQESVANDNAVWLATMLPRTRTATISAATNASPIVLTVTGHGFAGGTTRAYVEGVGGNTAANGFYSSVALTDANTITLTGSSGNGSYTGGGTIGGFTPQELATIDAFNLAIRQCAIDCQLGDLIAVSDIAADAVANPSLYPNTGGSSGFWQDPTHPNTAPLTNFYQGAGQIAKRMSQLRTAPPQKAIVTR